MVTGASTADCAVILIDARKGLLTQTRRHSYLVSLLGIRHVALAVNKLDLVDYSRGRGSREIEAEYRGVRRASSGSSTSRASRSPRCAATTSSSAARGRRGTEGPTLLEYLETVEVDEDRMQARLRSGCPCSGSTGPTPTSAASPG